MYTRWLIIVHVAKSYSWVEEHLLKFTDLSILVYLTGPFSIKVGYIEIEIHISGPASCERICHYHICQQTILFWHTKLRKKMNEERKHIELPEKKMS